MSPVLGYARGDRSERSQRLERSESPHSNDSSDSNRSLNARQRLADRFRRGSEPNTGNTSPSTSDEHSRDSCIEECCLGRPKKVSQSHSGGVELFISLQEKAVFLPTVKNRHRHRRSSHSARNNPSANGSSHADGNSSRSSRHQQHQSTSHSQHSNHHRDLHNASNFERRGSTHSASAADRARRDSTSRASLRERQGSVGRAQAPPSAVTSAGAALVTSSATAVTAAANSTIPESAHEQDNQFHRQTFGSGQEEHTFEPELGSDLDQGRDQYHEAREELNEPALNQAQQAHLNLHSYDPAHENDNDNEHEEDHEEDDLPPEFSAATANEPTPASAAGGTEENADDDNNGSTCSTLRGSVLLKLAKPTKIKEIGINFYCVSRTLWNLLPQPALFVDSALPNNAQVEDMAYLGIHRWDFVPLEQFGPAQSSYDRVNLGQSSTLIGQDLFGADAAVMNDKPNEVLHRKYCRVYNSQICRIQGHESHQVPIFGPLVSQPRKLKQNNAQVEGVVFPAGSYVYNFTLLIDAKTPATVSVPNGQVKFVLGAKVVRAGAFNLNVHGHMDVDVVRAPQEASEAISSGPQNDSVLLSRVWDDKFVYSMNLERRSITLDVPTKLTLNLMPLSDPDVRIHQMQVYVSETVTYIYSLDQAIRYVDPSLKLLLFEKKAPRDGSLMPLTETASISTKLTLVSEHNQTPKQHAIEPFLRGRYGELRFLEPDVKGPYIRVRHKLHVVLHVSRKKKNNCPGRNRYEVNIDTPITVLSRHCVSDNISLPSYNASYLANYSNNTSSENDEYDESDLPPSFDDAMEHRLLGPSGAQEANPKGTKACFTPTTAA